ncbi:MAG: hypothetical protein FWC11_05265 [Firmicutes bacterium]|nr:hypothetical protein [Bacillota bacterium]
MTKKKLIILTIALIFAMAFLTGCFLFDWGQEIVSKPNPPQTSNQQETIPFIQQVNSNFGANNEFIIPRYAYFDNDRHTYYGGPNAQPTYWHDEDGTRHYWIAWWLNHYSHEVIFGRDEITFSIAFHHPHTAVTAWLRNVEIDGNTIVFNVNRLDFTANNNEIGGGDAITHVYISAQIKRVHVQNITGYRIVRRDVYQPARPRHAFDSTELEGLMSQWENASRNSRPDKAWDVLFATIGATNMMFNRGVVSQSQIDFFTEALFKAAENVKSNRKVHGFCGQMILVVLEEDQRRTFFASDFPEINVIKVENLYFGTEGKPPIIFIHLGQECKAYNIFAISLVKERIEIQSAETNGIFCGGWVGCYCCLVFAQWWQSNSITD